MDIMSGLAAFTHILDITKELRGVDRRISDAEFKLRIADLVERVLEAREALLDAKERERELHEKIQALSSEINQRQHLIDENGCLYETDDNGNRRGEPYCNLCYVKETKLFRLRHLDPTQSTFAAYQCDNCNTYIKTGPALPRTPPRVGTWGRTRG